MRARASASQDFESTISAAKTTQSMPDLSSVQNMQDTSGITDLKVLMLCADEPGMTPSSLTRKVGYENIDWFTPANVESAIAGLESRAGGNYDRVILVGHGALDGPIIVKKKPNPCSSLKKAAMDLKYRFTIADVSQTHRTVIVLRCQLMSVLKEPRWRRLCWDCKRQDFLSLKDSIMVPFEAREMQVERKRNLPERFSKN